MRTTKNNKNLTEKQYETLQHHNNELKTIKTIKTKTSNPLKKTIKKQ